jgi:hypothetical protein
MDTRLTASRRERVVDTQTAMQKWIEELRRNGVLW